MKTVIDINLYLVILWLLLWIIDAPLSAQPSEIDSTMSTKMVNVNNESFPIIDQGSGPAVLMLHGFPDSKELWKHQVPALSAAGYRVIAPDLRGYGDAPSPLEKEQYAIPLLMGDVVGILDALGLEQVHLIGHDWGAALSWQLATYFPHRFRSLMVLSVGHPGNPGWVTMQQREKSWYFYLFLQERLAEKTLADNNWAFTRKFLSSHKDLDQVLERIQQPNALTTALNWYRGNLQQMVTQPDTEYPVTNEQPRAPKERIEIPVLGVWSDEDIALLEPQMKLSAEYASNFTYRKINGAGHWMMLDKPDELNRLILEFLN